MALQRINVEPARLFSIGFSSENERFASGDFVTRCAGARTGEHLRFTRWEQVMGEVLTWQTVRLLCCDYLKSAKYLSGCVEIAKFSFK